jgi:2-phosphosulfolactate phosphatase
MLEIQSIYLISMGITHLCPMVKKLDVILSPSLIENYNFENKTVVVIDILRATTTICTALQNGASFVYPVETLQEASLLKQNGYLAAAERNGEMVEGFDLGNSPKEYTKELVQNQSIVLTTTNGTRCIRLSGSAQQILVGAFSNISKLEEYLKTDKNDLLLFCAGWKHKVNLEDTLFAGALAKRVAEWYQWDNDSVEIAVDLYDYAKKDLQGYVKKAAHAKRFEALGVSIDTAYCLQEDTCSVLPQLVDNKLINIL